MQLCWPLGQEELLLVLLQVVLQRLILPWKFWWGFKREFGPLVFCFFWFQIAQIVEAGPHTRDEPNHIQPGRYLSCLLRPTETFTFHVAKPSPALCDRSVVVPTGRALGGGSSVNCMKAIFCDWWLNWSNDLKSFFTQGRQLRITTIGKTYMEMKDGVLSIWYRFSKKWELYSLPSTLEITSSHFYRQRHINQLQSTLLMENQDRLKCR